MSGTAGLVSQKLVQSKIEVVSGAEKEASADDVPPTALRGMTSVKWVICCGGQPRIRVVSGAGAGLP